MRFKFYEATITFRDLFFPTSATFLTCHVKGIKI